MNPMPHHLVLFFNEDYSKNIPTLERVYGGRFDQISYIVPDHYSRLERWYRYPGRSYRLANGCDWIINRMRRLLGRRNAHEHLQTENRLDVARVIGFKYYFQDFFWQARESLLASSAEWFWFVSDDVLLNPRINQQNILDFLSVSSGSRSVICEPYYCCDEWVNRIQGSSDAVTEKLRAVYCYAGDHGAWAFLDDPYRLGGPNQRRVSGGCADFLGSHRDLLGLALDAFHALALHKVFVEIAVPNVFLALDRTPTLTSSFIWEYDTGRGSSDRIQNFITAPWDRAFYHPVKFSLLGPELTERIVAASATG